MRFLGFLALLVVGAACAAPVANDAEDVGESSESGLTAADTTSCSMSRNAIWASVTGARRTAITRGFSWFDAHVPYSQVRFRDGYRTDCSGFLSMCWQAPVPGAMTWTFATDDDYTFLSSYDDLVPGDGIDDVGNHVVMFLGWNDEAHTGACVLEERSAGDMSFHVRPTASLKRNGYKPFRPTSFDR